MLFVKQLVLSFSKWVKTDKYPLILNRCCTKLDYGSKI
jgi:hypothetical protein